MKRKIRQRISALKSVWPFKKLSESLFGKFFTACALVILLCFLFLGTVVTLISVNYSNNQKVSTYKTDAQMVSMVTLSELQKEQMYYGINDIANRQIQAELSRDVQNFSMLFDANVFVLDKNGDIITGCTVAQSRNDVLANKVPGEFMTILNSKKEFQSVGMLGNFFAHSQVVYGTPILDDTQESSGDVIGGVLITSRADSLIAYISYLIRIFIICVAVALAFAFVAIYLLTLRLVHPLRQMSSAAKSFAKGDFAIRVPVGDKDEIGQLAVAFNNMAASLTTLEDMRRSFVANVSHELKTPMTSIAGFIDGILDGTIPPERREYYLGIVSDEVKRLSRLVRQFLDIARIEAGELKINPAKFDVEETIRRVIVGFEYAINEKQLTVKGLDENADREMWAYGDPDLTHQIIYNLVDNAVKFANTGGTIEISVVSNGKTVYVGVKNSGMGISQRDLPFVFDRFYKTDKSRALDRKGVGLGLYIAKTVLNMQDQDITVKSVEGEYCEFVITLKAV